MHPSTPQAPLPPPPPLWSFLEHSVPRILLEVGIGAMAGWFLAGTLPTLLGGDGAGSPIPWAVAGSILAPLSLLLTPSKGPLGARALRYGLSLAVLGTLLLSFTGPGRDRPLDELLLAGVFLGTVGAVGHGLLLLSTKKKTSSGSRPIEL